MVLERSDVEKGKRVNLDIKDGRIVGIHHSDHVTPLPLDTKHVSLAASATSPLAQVPEDLKPSNEIQALSVSNESFLLYENGEDFVKTMHRADHEIPPTLNTYKSCCTHHNIS
ncbi:hypothetical protein NC652_003106 [Populus alba x Populus x berolinensis]|uniref:Uncharacterized protein n=1 Tax=Populus alba TaxID=43335 RepID=A0ACC4D3H3_POPAL|nr:hypothetical protein NC652_003106 [Populus alba x Populus x berolinensis]